MYKVQINEPAPFHRRNSRFAYHVLLVILLTFHALRTIHHKGAPAGLANPGYPSLQSIVDWVEQEP